MAPTIFEIIASLNKRYYAPRPAPTPIPSARWDEAPCKCLAVNDEWVSHIIGVMDALDQFDTWIGSEAEVNDARQQVGEIMAALIGDEPMNCCCDSTPLVILHHVTIDGQSEVSYDGGLTWQPDPDSLPISAIALPPPVTAGVSGTKCDAASNGLQHIKDTVAAQVEALAEGATITSVALSIATFLIGLLLGPEVAIPALVAVIIAVVNAIAALNTGIFETYWSSDVYDTILCALFCHISDDGSFTAESYAAAVADIQSGLPNSAARDWLIKILQAMGLTGFNNLCAYGSSADADCSSCECGGCSLAGWTVALGTFVSRTNTSITVSSFHTGNQWLAAIQASDINDCCIFRDSVVDPPGSLTEIAVTPCGLPQGTNLHFSYTFYEVNYILAGSTYGPFTIQFKSALA